jgi:AraC family transcriptional regulator
MGGNDQGRPGAPEISVEFSSSKSALRHTAAWTGVFAETFEVTDHLPFEIAATSPFHLLIVNERAERVDGETFIEGLPKSRLRRLTGRLCLVPAGHRFAERQTPRVSARIIHLHIDPAGPLLEPQLRFSEMKVKPRLLFDDRDLWETALKLKMQIDKLRPNIYAEALGVVLAYEVIRLNAASIEAPQGGLAEWQQNRLVEYIDAHLDEDVSLKDLANIANLSHYHFSRSFKRSFGEPPHHYLNGRRIERAKALLENPARSVTEVALAVGFADPVLFTAAFHRLVGTTPTKFRRSLR